MPTNGHDGYVADLQKVNPYHRAPLEDFIHDGIIPEPYPRLMQVLANPDSASTCSDHAVAAFLAAHCPDVAYGHLAYVVRWESLGGLRGRLQ
jgi:hypothetical protein